MLLRRCGSFPTPGAVSAVLRLQDGQLLHWKWDAEFRDVQDYTAGASDTLMPNDSELLNTTNMVGNSKCLGINAIDVEVGSLLPLSHLNFSRARLI